MSEKQKRLYTSKTNIIIVVCKGARAAKGGGLKILWYRPSRVRIPSLALFFFTIVGIQIDCIALLRGHPPLTYVRKAHTDRKQGQYECDHHDGCHAAGEERVEYRTHR